MPFKSGQMAREMRPRSDNVAVKYGCFRGMALDGGAPTNRLVLGCPLFQRILVVVQGLSHARMLWEDNAGFWHMKME